MNRKLIFHFIEFIIIVSLLVALIFFTIKDINLQKEVSKNCGFENEKWRCFCDKKIIDKNISLNLSNNTLILK